MDVDHLGEEGWIQIKSFDFGFGIEGKLGASGAKAGSSGKKTPAQLEKENADLRKAAAETVTPKKPSSWGKSGVLNFDPLNFTKRADILSKPLLEICDAGKLIPTVRLVMCRPSGAADQEKKIEFLSLTFKQVFIKSCTMALVNDELPEERVQAGYKFVKLES